MAFRVVRIVLIVLFLAIIGIAIWMWATPDGQDAADELSERWQGLWHNTEARDAAWKLMFMKAHFSTVPPSPDYVAMECMNLSLGDDGFRLVGKCFHLKTVAFTNTDMNDRRMQCLDSLPHLVSLTIIDKTPTVTDAGIKHLASTPRLVGLILQNTLVSDEGLKQVGRLTELGTLSLDSTRVTDAGMPALTGLKKLQWLVLSNTAVSDDGVAKLQGMTSLRQITLKGSQVTAKGRAQLRKMYPGLTTD